MSAQFRANQGDLDAISDLLDEVDRSLQDLRPAWAELRQRWQERVRQQWQTARWKPLSKRYARQVGRTEATLDTSVGRAPAGLGHPPGQMRRLVQEPETFEADRDSLVMGVRWGVGRSDAFYAQFHTEGRGVPKRRVWKRLSPAERSEWTDVVLEQALEPLNRRR